MKTVLVVDDEPEVRMAFAAPLRFVGFAVIEAASGEEALSAAETARPDLVLLDILMPGIDGWSVIERLRTNPTTAAVPVLAVTAGQFERGRFATAGFDGCLLKPISPYRVMTEVERRIGVSEAVADSLSWQVPDRVMPWPEDLRPVAR